MIERLKKRRVFRALVTWGIASFALLQVVEPVMHGLDLPAWVLKVAVVLLALGFPVVAVLAQALDLRAIEVERAAERAAAGAEGEGEGGRGPGAVKAWPVLLLVGVGLVMAAPGVAWYLVLRDRRAAAEAAPAPAASTPSVAVLPFLNMTGDPGQEYFADGVAEEILNALAQLPGLQVTGRTSSFSFKGKSDDLRVIGERLGVRSVLEGSVRKSGSRIRVTAQLVKVADGYHLWSETFDRNLDDVFAVQDEIADAVARALRVRLVPGAAPGAPAEPPRPASVEAYDQYLLGRELNHRGSAEALVRAQAALERSVALDPGFAPAWSALASTLSNRAADPETGREGEALQRRAWAAAEKAVALAPGWSDGYRVRGNLRARDRWDWKGAGEDLDHALALAPNDYAVVADRAISLLAPLGRTADAAHEVRRALALEPLSSTLWSNLCWLELHRGERAEARRACERAQALSAENVFAQAYLAELELADGQADAALARTSRLADEETRLFYAAMAQHAAGRAAESSQALEALERRFGGDAPYDVARARAFRGERDPAFAWLERALAQRDANLCSLKVELSALLGADPRWAPLLARVGLTPERG